MNSLNSNNQSLKIKDFTIRLPAQICGLLGLWQWLIPFDQKFKDSIPGSIAGYVGSLDWF